jgi:fatty acid desaturase
MTLRIGDSERDAAIERLSQHAAAGRLTVRELEQRIERVHAAVFEADLDAIEADLPAPPARRRAAAAAWPPVPLLAVALLVLAIAASVAIGHPAPPLFLLAVFAFRRLQRRAV